MHKPHVYISDRYKMSVGVLDMAHNVGIDFKSCIERLMMFCDVIILCNVNFSRLRVPLSAIEGINDGTWRCDDRNDSWGDRNNDRQHLDDVVICNEYIEQESLLVWNELRRLPLRQNFFFNQKDLVWCPGIRWGEETGNVNTGRIDKSDWRIWM